MKFIYFSFDFIPSYKSYIIFGLGLAVRRVHSVAEVLIFSVVGVCFIVLLE